MDQPAPPSQRQFYLDGKADGQQNLITRIAANWAELRKLKAAELPVELQRLTDQIYDDDFPSR